ncbi:hypothetical protein [Microbacterium hibisci]|uniref:hypothetical protein n=1 Tax=Microbacterium hibisci TaxID=2036000 RepID=UPI001943FAD1|nr:hypothetical protein [Microbacterium hibisci]
MTDTIAAGDAADLQARLDALEAENARLRAGTDAAAARASTAPAGSRWRAFFSALCIVIAGILVPISIVAAWARLELVDESAFVETLAPLAEDPAVQQMIIDETVEAVEAQVDFEEITANVFDGIDQLGLPPRASQALQLLQAPAASGLENLLTQTVTRVVESDAFADTWTATTRAAHRALTTAATSDGGGIVVMTDDGLGIQLGAIVERVKQNLMDRGVGIAQLIPAIDRVVIIGTGETLVTIRTTYAIATTLGWWLPIITIGLFVLGILIARRRSTAVMGSGIAFAVGGGVLALAFAIGYPVVGQTAAQLGVSAPAVDVVYQSLIGSMQQTASIAVLLGVVIAVIGWFAGRWSPAVRSRQAISNVNSSLRRQLGGHGLRTGRVGAWLFRYRGLVRTLVVVLAVIWLFALRPLSAGDIFLVLIVALLVAWILELLQVRPDEQADGELDAVGAVDAEAPGIAEDADTLVIADTVVVGSPDTVDTEVIDGTPGAAAGPAAAPGAKKRP